MLVNIFGQIVLFVICSGRNSRTFRTQGAPGGLPVAKDGRFEMIL